VGFTGQRVAKVGDTLRRSFGSLTAPGECNARVGLTGQRLEVANGMGALRMSFSSLTVLGECSATVGLTGEMSSEWRGGVAPGGLRKFGRWMCYVARKDRAETLPHAGSGSGSMFLSFRHSVGSEQFKNARLLE
jgi:hypothetical protein